MESAARASASETAACSGASPRSLSWRRSHPLPNNNTLYVSGYPRVTYPKDLKLAFSKYGDISVEKINSQFALLAFATDDVARTVLQDSNVQIAGHSLTVTINKPKITKPEEDLQNSPRRDFPMTKQKGIITDPNNIDLSGDFHSQVDRVLAAVRLSQDEVKALSSLYYDLEKVLQAQWPGCTAVPFGSITTGLGVKTSDADCFINIPLHYRHPNGNYVNRAKRLLESYPHIFTEILSIPRANTPIVKFFHVPTATNCDVSFKTPLGAQNSRLITYLLQADPRLVPVAVIIKYWAKVHQLTGTGKLTNYALTMMIIFYLQQPPVSILPAVQWLQRDPAYDVIVDYWNTGFVFDREIPRSTNKSTISELLGGFFEFYSMFNFEEMIVCPFVGTPIKKEIFKDVATLPEEFARYKYNVVNELALPIRVSTPICVQDPFEQSHNVASTINSKLAAEIKAYLKFAANAYENDKPKDCTRFLRSILLEKPKIVRSKTHPEFRVHLFARMISNIVHPDWKSVVRDIIFVIFEQICQIKLGKVEEKVNPDSKKEKEKYMGAITKAIWKRKQFSKLYSVMKMDFLQKEMRITEEILNVDKHQLNLQFQVTITYCHNPKSSGVAIKLTNGDVEAFKELGKFFISVMQNWFVHLAKPFTKSTAFKIAKTIADEEIRQNLTNMSNDDNVNGNGVRSDSDDLDNSAVKPSDGTLSDLDNAKDSL